MVQFNLLPDIKIQYLKARREKHMVMLVSTITIVACAAVLVILLGVVFGLQKKNISDLTNNINSKSAQLQSTPNLNKMLTVQNQLNSLPTLHSAKPVATRLYTFISQVTPTSASISQLTADFQENTLNITGGADSLATVTAFTDALKYATYHTTADPKTEKTAFTSVVLSNFSVDAKGATYTITLSFDPALFSEQSDVVLTVPNTTTSSIGVGGALFQSANGGSQ
jgi:Tfp pilus assembly protein PilN